jgi:flagellar biosynthesis/type III secretory pathway M-ring protein FliF/YscJ
MRTEPPSPLASALGRLRGAAGRLRRWLAARGAVTRVALLVVGLAALGALGYLASINEPAGSSWAWIYERRKLSSDDVDKISEALDAADIPHFADSLGRVGVKPSRRQEALALLAKAKVVPPSLDDLSQDLEAASPFEAPGERERREQSRLEQMLKAQIERLDPAISSALVKIHRVKKRYGPAALADASASVYLLTDGGRKLGHRVIEGIQRLLAKDMPELKPEAIWVVDQTGHAYLDPGNPSLKAQVQTHVREEEWQDKIQEELRHIPGLGVSVLLEAVPAPPPEVPLAVAVELVRPNGQVDLVDAVSAAAVPAPTEHTTHVKANVLVRVPRSFYLLDFQSRSSGRQPTQEDLEPMRLTTEKVIKDAVEIHIPKEELGVVKVAVIQDDLASARPVILTSSPEAARPWAWVALSGAVSAAGMLAVAGLVRLATRRPSGRPSRASWRPGLVADGPSGPEPVPSERVRELIRLNPEAAAGVLQRWIGQGGMAE